MNKMLKNVDLATLVGSWPYVPDPSAVAQPSLLTGVVSPYATIISVKKSNDFDLNGKSFKLYVDSFVGSPFTISFTADNMTLDQVVARINALTAAYGTVAYNDNGFLKLKSIVPGNDGYLRLQSIATSESVFSILGLFSETEVYGGEIRQAPHADPSRGVALPGQMLMARGESFSSNVLNRIAFQAANQATRLSGFYEKKRIAITTEKQITYGGSGTWFQTSDIMYTGAVGTPTPAQLESIIGVVDLDGNEIVREYEDDVRNYTPGDVIIASVDPVTNDQYIQITSATCTFDADDAEHDAYVVLGGLPPPDNTLNGVQLKVLRIITWAPPLFKVAVLAVDPSGNVHHFTSTPTSMYRTLINRYKVQVSGFYKEIGLVNRVENLNDQLVPPLPAVNLPITRLEKNNRIVVDTADFVTNNVSEGDVVTWTGFATSGMFSNNGVYRVGKVVDEVTIELLDENFGPVLLNPSYSGAGDVVVKTDGRFWNNPYIKFDPQGRASPPVPTGNFKVIYQIQSSLKTSLDVNPAAFATNVKYQQEASAVVERALIGIVGPTASSLTDVLNYLYGDARHSLEDLYAQSMREHHDYSSLENGGRHSTIHPDKIDMYPGVAGTTVIVRSASVAEDKGGGAIVDKFTLKTSAGLSIVTVRSDGRVKIDNGPTANIPLATGYSLEVSSGSGDVAAAVYSQPGYSAAFDVTSGFDASKYAKIRVTSSLGIAESDLHHIVPLPFSFRADVATTPFMGTNLFQFLADHYLGGVSYDYRNFAFCHQPVNNLLKLDGKIGTTEYNAIMAWKASGEVGINTTSPDHYLTIKSRNDVNEQLLNLVGNSATQTEVDLNMNPTGGENIGTLRAIRTGTAPGERYFVLDANYILYLHADNEIYLDAGGSTKWTIDTSGNIIPNATTQDIGSVSKYIAQLHVKDIYGDTNDYLGYDRTDNNWKFYIGSVLKSTLGLNPLSADFTQFALGGDLDDTTKRLLMLSRDWDGATHWVNELRFNDGSVNPRMSLRWDSDNSDAISIWGDLGTGLANLMLFEGKTFIPGVNATAGYSVGAAAKKWYDIFAQWGRFRGSDIDPSVADGEVCTDRNAQNAVVARAHGASAGRFQGGSSSRWNVASISRPGTGNYRIYFTDPVDVDSTVLATADSGNLIFHTGVWDASGGYVELWFLDTSGVAQNTTYTFAVIGKKY